MSFMQHSDDKNNDDRLRYRNRTGLLDDDLNDDDDDDDDDNTDEFDATEDKCAIHVEHWGSLSPQAWKGDDAYLIRDGSDTEVETDMLTYLLNRGTLAVCVDATMWASYVTGTMFNCGNIATADINHCVQIVGITYNAHHDIGYYKVRNSWGSNWGDAGYIYLAFGQVGVDNHPTYYISYFMSYHIHHVLSLCFPSRTHHLILPLPIPVHTCGFRIPVQFDIIQALPSHTIVQILDPLPSITAIKTA